MKRGGYGKPWRPPEDGWFVPNKVFFGGLYQHIRPALNNLPRYQNNTQAPLQPNQVGSPLTRINPAALVANCDVTDTSGLPRIPWIGVGANQFLPPVLGGALQNTFQLNGTNSLGQAARLRGFKNVQALRQWHGTPPWTAHDPAGCASTYCNTAQNDIDGKTPPAPGWIPTYSSTPFEPYQSTPNNLKYLTCTVAANLSEFNLAGATSIQVTAAASGSVSVDAFSGKKTSALSTSQVNVLTNVSTGVPATTVNITNGYDSVANTRGNATALDTTCGADVHCSGAPIPSLGTVDGGIGWFNNLIYNAHVEFEGDEGSLPDPAETITPLPPVTDPNNYSATGTLRQSFTNTDDTGNPYTQFSQQQMILSWTRSATVYTWSLSYIVTQNSSAAPTGTITFISNQYSGTLTLSNPITAASIYVDIENLLGYWNLADDAQYPPRTDGIWQIAPLVSRDEAFGNVTPLGFNTAYVNDLRQPTVDANGNGPFTTPATPPPLGWILHANNDAEGHSPADPAFDGTSVPWNPTYNQMAWFDPAAYGFSFPAGFDQSNSAANGWGQFALSGLICGLPMPRAFTDPNSFWYSPADPVPPAGATFENFFDFRANVWRACQYKVDDAPYTDFYEYGYGQWLYDMIDSTGAQLPHCATQWTNLMQAFNKPPYAYLIQADQQTYDADGQPSPDADFKAYQGDGLWAQKCCEILELWPSQNFGRPAGNDRFAPDELAVYCIGSVSGNVITLNSSPTGIANSDYVGMASNGFSGIYAVAAVSTLANTVTLVNGPVYPLPTGFALPSNDTGTCLWRVRFKSAPPIQGRDAIANLAASGGNTIITLASAEVNLMTGDTIDICSTAITRDAKGNRVSEQMTVLQTVAVSRTDDTHFTVGVAIGTLAGAAYIVSHGAAAWYWDDNGRKGDFATFQWLYDYRTNGEASRLSGVLDCTELANRAAWVAAGSIGTPPTNSDPPPVGTPAANTGFQAPTMLPSVCSPGNSLNWTGDNFQAQGASAFKPCCYGVVAITPNGETWNNGVVIPFPAAFTFDERYGARWQAEVEQAMQDLLWQAPHSPCGLDSGITWTEDDGTCHVNTDTNIYYAFAPIVEARLSLPGNGGNGQNETAPALPAGIAIGYVNPVTTLTNALTPPGMIGFDPTTGNPVGAFTFWGYRLTIENNACFGTCQFNYVDMENLPCVISYDPSAPAPLPDTTGQGGTNGGST